jgi:uncharacterized protein (DUF305 family)
MPYKPDLNEAKAQLFKVRFLKERIPHFKGAVLEE